MCLTWERRKWVSSCSSEVSGITAAAQKPLKRRRGPTRRSSAAAQSLVFTGAVLMLQNTEDERGALQIHGSSQAGRLVGRSINQPAVSQRRRRELASTNTSWKLRHEPEHPVSCRSSITSRIFTAPVGGIESDSEGNMH